MGDERGGPVWPDFRWCADPEVTDPLPGLPGLRRIACQVATDAAYHIIPHPHQRRGFAVLQYTLAGCGVFRDAEGERRLPAGTAFLCHAEDPHVQYRHPGRGRPWRFVYASWFCPRETIAALVAGGPLYRFAGDHPLVCELLAWRGRSRPRLSGARSAELATRLITTLAESRPARRPLPAPSLVARIERELAARPAVPGVAELARRLGMSREHLSRRFAADTGATLRDHLQRLRLEQATRLLRSADAPPVREIARRCGFSDSGHLARHFRRLHGIPPLRYRRLVHEGSEL